MFGELRLSSHEERSELRKNILASLLEAFELVVTGAMLYFGFFPSSSLFVKVPNEHYVLWHILLGIEMLWIAFCVFIRVSLQYSSDAILIKGWNACIYSIRALYIIPLIAMWLVVHASGELFWVATGKLLALLFSYGICGTGRPSEYISRRDTIFFAVSCLDLLSNYFCFFLISADLVLAQTMYVITLIYHFYMNFHVLCKCLVREEVEPILDIFFDNDVDTDSFISKARHFFRKKETNLRLVLICLLDSPAVGICLLLLRQSFTLVAFLCLASSIVSLVYSFSNKNDFGHRSRIEGSLPVPSKFGTPRNSPTVPRSRSREESRTSSPVKNSPSLIRSRSSEASVMSGPSHRNSPRVLRSSGLVYSPMASPRTRRAGQLIRESEGSVVLQA